MNQEEHDYCVTLIRELMDQGFKAYQIPRLLSMRIWYEESKRSFEIGTRIGFLHWLVKHGQLGGQQDGTLTQ